MIIVLFYLDEIYPEWVMIWIWPGFVPPTILREVCDE